MDTWETAVELVLGLEGEGGTAEPGDAGGVTKWGFSQRYNSDIDVKTISRDGAKSRYHEKVWNALGLDRLPPALGIAVFNGAVNPGPHEAVVALQQALIVKPDGVLGPVTAAVAKEKPVGPVLADFHSRLGFYYATRPAFQHDGHGWLRRLFVVEAVCVAAMAPAPPATSA